jgi:hypothetical protein
MIRKVFGGAILALGMTGALAAQSPSASPAQQPPATPAMAAHTVTVEGCLVLEKDIPGRQPNVAEKAGVMEDYILTSAKFLKGSPHSSAATGTAGATGTSGVADVKLEVRGIDDEQLKKFAGQRVEIEGKVDPADFGERAAEKATGEKSGDLPEIEGTVIRKATSTTPCPMK